MQNKFESATDSKNFSFFFPPSQPQENQSLCIILQSSYPQNNEELQKYIEMSQDTTVTLLDCQKLNEEVRVDFETVRETLKNNDIIGIIIPVFMKIPNINLILGNALDNAGYPYTQCHIVLNTHGVPGKSDLPNNAVKKLILELSNKGIYVKQLSALQCNAMDTPLRDPTTQAGKSSHLMSSMRILQDKLEHLQTSIPQQFKIYGFDRAYDPKIEKEEVIHLLHGEGIMLPVKIKLSTKTKFIDSEKIALDIFMLKTTEKEWMALESLIQPKSKPSSDEYKRFKKLRSQRDKAVTNLGKMLEMMYQNIVTDRDKKTITIKPEFQPLVDALRKFADKKGESFESLSANECGMLFKDWKRNSKVNHTPEWHRIVENYNNFLLNKRTSQKTHSICSSSTFFKIPDIEPDYNFIQKNNLSKM